MTKARFLIALASLALFPAASQAGSFGAPDDGSILHSVNSGFAPSPIDGAGAPGALADAGSSASDAAEPQGIDLRRDLLPPDTVLRSDGGSRPLDNTLAEPLPVGDNGDAYADLWDRIRDNFRMSAGDDTRVTRATEWFENHREYVTRLTERSRRYLYFIVDEVEKRGMPGEIALLPIVESAFDPRALSSAKAAGMWQFMPATGKLYGLRQNWWYDGRRDVVAATNGALDYLQKLHAQFGAWDLALAAYNCGEGAVAHAIERNQRAGRPTDYASLQLPEETRNYVPKLLAAREIVNDPEAHGLSLLSIPDRPYFTVVTTSRHVDLAVAARLAGIPESEFLALNPGYNRPLILAQGEQNILVPTAVAEVFTARLNDPDAHLVSWRPHRLRRGESYASVASRFGMSSDEFKRVNGIAAHRRVAGGGTVLVRDAMAAEGDLDALADSGASEAEIAPPMETVTFSHRVRRGESLASIARRYNVGVASLRTWNRIPRSQGARMGQLLVMHRTGEVGEPELKSGLADATVVRSTTLGAAAGDAANGPFESSLVEVTQSRHGRHAKGHRHTAGQHGKGAPAPHSDKHATQGHDSKAKRKH
ncbi:MAG: transglycosylase SLT domain-containing protein [Pseudomonadota bacterium]|nr:transglycosylase SLT domain-containing protein [Pseudomonadota bacterium]